jgi:hypothetical protein
MTIRDIAEVRARLEEAVAGLPGEHTNAQDLFERTEELAIEILDCELDWYPPGHLQELLTSYLYIRQIELGLLPDIHPQQEA